MDAFCIWGNEGDGQLLAMIANATSTWINQGTAQGLAVTLGGVVILLLLVRLVRLEGIRMTLLRELRDKEGRSAGAASDRDGTHDNQLTAEALSRQNEELDRRVNQRTEELAEVTKELDAFAYSVSHDLQVPLRSIKNFTGYLSEEYEHLLDGRGRGYLGYVRASAARMQAMISDLLQLARASRSELSRERVDLGVMAREVVGELQNAWPERHVEFLGPSHLDALGDPQLLRLVLTNLLANAWKFTGKVRQPRVEFGRLGVNGVSTFFVRDNGAGFDMRYAERLFGAFQRIHPASEFEGVGVGLATVQRVVHRHGGKVWAKAKVNGGATFYFALPNKPTPLLPEILLNQPEADRTFVSTHPPAH